MSWHRADSKRRTSLQHSDRSPRGSTPWDAGDGSRCGHAFAGEAKRLLRGAGRVARLEHIVQRVCWRSDATSAEADGRCREGDRADSERHDLG